MLPSRRKHGASRMAIIERGSAHQEARGQPSSSSKGSASERSDETAEGSRTYGDLLSDPQIRRWLERALLGVGVGALVTFFFGLQLGVTAAAIVVVFDVVRKARNSSSITAWQKSSAAERRTEKQLKGLTRNGYR